MIKAIRNQFFSKFRKETTVRDWPELLNIQYVERGLFLTWSDYIMFIWGPRKHLSTSNHSRRKWSDQVDCNTSLPAAISVPDPSYIACMIAFVTSVSMTPMNLFHVLRWKKIAYHASCLHRTQGIRVCIHVIIDNKFKLDDDIWRLSSLWFYHLCQQQTVCRALTVDTKKSLSHAFVTSHVYYCSSILGVTSIVHICMLQSIPNATAWLTVRKGIFNPMTAPVRNELHWFPINLRSDYKLSLLILKFLQWTDLPYLLISNVYIQLNLATCCAMELFSLVVEHVAVDIFLFYLLNYD